MQHTDTPETVVGEAVYNCNCTTEPMVGEAVYTYTCTPELMVAEAVQNYTSALERMVGETVHNTCSPGLMIGKTVNNYLVHRSSWLPSLCTTTRLRWNAWLARPRQLFMYIGTRD